MNEWQEGNYILLFRKIIEWEWYGNSIIKDLFIHCLLKANYKEKEWQGIEIKRGQFVTSVSKLSAELGFSTQQIRSGIKKLKNTQEITIKTTNKYTILAVENYEDYQLPISGNNKQLNKQITNKQQTNNKQITTTNKDNNKNKEEAYSVFDFWNSKKIIIHKKLNDKIIRKISTELKNYSVEEIIQSIENYSKIINDPSCYFSYKWTLIDFLQRGVDKFLDYNTAKENYKEKGFKTEQTINHRNLPEL